MSQNEERRDFLTRFAISLDQTLYRHCLLDIPRGLQWRIYWFSVHIHVALTSVLMVLGVSCFCTGVQQSFMYDEVNCADGVSIAAPMANVFVVYYALMAVKHQASHWAAFEQFIMTFVVFFFNLVFMYDQLSMGLRWQKKPVRTEQNWPLHFAVMDYLMVLVLFALEITCLGVIVVYLLLLTDCRNWRRRAEQNLRRAGM